MRSVRFVMTPSGGFPRGSQRLHEENVFTRDAVRQFNILDDGTAVIACAVEGDLDRARRLLDDQPELLSYEVADAGGSGVVYVHVQPPEPLERLFRVESEHEVLFEFPLEIVSDGGDISVRATMIAETDETLQEAVAEFSSDASVTVERIGPHRPGARDALSGLTERQRKVLDIALEMGYYETPRRTTHADIAERASLEPATVSRHLQRIESHTLRALAE